MRGGFVLFGLSVLLGCSSGPPDRGSGFTPERIVDNKSAPTPETVPVEVKKEPVGSLPKVDVIRTNFPKGGGSIKGSSTPEPETEWGRPTTGDQLLFLQRERFAKQPESDMEKMRLALLYLSSGNFPEAERYVTLVRGESDFLPYLKAYLYRKLGETKMADKLHAELDADWSKSDGFRIERAVLVKSVQGYQRYDLHTEGKVSPGSTVIIYMQPENFSLRMDGEQSILHLGYDWKLVDDRNKDIPVPWWENANPNDRMDFIKYRGAVREFFQYFRLKLPGNLATGNYRIKVTVTDKNASREDRIYIPLYVVPTQ